MGKQDSTDKAQASKEMQAYFKQFEKDCFEAFKIANTARKKEIDPYGSVEIKLAKTMAERVIGLVSTIAPRLVGAGADKRIKELETEYGTLDFRVALKIALEVAQERFCKFSSQKEALEVGIRVGFCYITLGVVSAPLEGFTGLEIKNRRDGKGEYFCLNYAGPIRAAGGTAAAVSVLISDYVRKSFGYAEYDPSEKEVQRCHAELEDYNQYVSNLQYFPSKEESEFLISHLPVEISGDPSEKYEVSNVNVKDIPRIPTNRLRSGYCLVHAECLSLKAKKINARLKKWGGDFNLGHWAFVDEFLEIQKKQRAKGVVKTGYALVEPDKTYIKDIVAGRPVLGMPLRRGGFRLRYGRSRTSGYSAMSIHPATMVVLNEFLATATQLKVERPGKATALTACDTIEGPIVKLKDGSVLQVDSVEKAKKLKNDIERIIYAGDILACYGDFFDRAHVLVPPGYCPEFWVQELEKHTVDTYGSFDMEKLSYDTEVPVEQLKRIFENPLRFVPFFSVMRNLARKTGVPLHPAQTFFWTQISLDDLETITADISGSNKEFNDDGSIRKIIIPLSKSKALFELLGLPHILVNDEFVVIRGDTAAAVFSTLGFDIKTTREVSSIISSAKVSLSEKKKQKETDSGAAGISGEAMLSTLYLLSGMKLRDKAGFFIGARMARPEKAKHRKLTGSPHVLFPVGKEGGKLRSFQAALERKSITSEFRVFYCKSCNTESPLPICLACLKKTKPMLFCSQCGYIEHPCSHEPKSSKIMRVDVEKLLNAGKSLLSTGVLPDLIKGVRGTSNKEHYPEFFPKGLLRAKHNLCVNKDGTIRYDSSEVPITHFKPFETGINLQQLASLGYTKDIHGNEITSEHQVVELRPQDVILPCSGASPDEPADEIFFRTANFVDDELVLLYGQKPYYNLKSRKDLIGHYMLALAPHTSAAMLIRVAGFSKTQGFFAHPMVHAAMRRDCDGDEGCFILLMDAFLNFSKGYLSSSRGSTMDAPFVLTYNINPAEVDDMYLHLDLAWKYPLSFYEAAMSYKMPWEVNVKLVGDVFGTEDQYENIGFTHGTEDFNQGVQCSAYKLLPSMDEKLCSQMDLAEKLDAVDTQKVASLVIEKHFIRDTKGNLKKFSGQQFRCVNCNEKFRRPPLSGECTECRGRIIFTISEGSIIKYLDKSLILAEKYSVPDYLKQSLELLKSAVESIFGRDAEKQESLGKWC